MSKLDESIKGLRILHLAITAGGLFFGLIMLFLLQDTSPVLEMPLLIYLCAGLFVVQFVVSRVVYVNKLKAVKTLDNADEILLRYRSAFITKIAMLDGAFTRGDFVFPAAAIRMHDRVAGGACNPMAGTAVVGKTAA